VQGVGAKVALSLLSLLAPADLVRAIATQDKARLGQATGVGPKLALRLITELKDKAGGIAFATPNTVPSSTPNAASSTIPSTAAIHAAANDALSALTNLGYRPAEAHAAVQAALLKTGEDVSVGVLIKVALQEASR
jgi:holliday junction DNA helicase RuvA